MKADEQEVFPLGQPQQASAHQGTSREVKGVKRLFLNKTVSGGLHLGFWQPMQVLKPQGHGQLWCNDLHVTAFLDVEGRAENFVAPHDFVNAPFQDRHVE